MTNDEKAAALQACTGAVSVTYRDEVATGGIRTLTEPRATLVLPVVSVDSAPVAQVGVAVHPVRIDARIQGYVRVSDEGWSTRYFGYCPALNAVGGAYASVEAAAFAVAAFAVNA